MRSRLLCSSRASRMPGLQFEALHPFHQPFIQSASKGSESKSKRMIEYTLHTWMKYLSFGSLLKMQASCRRVCRYHLCFLLSTLPAAVSWAHDETRRVDRVAGLQDPPQTFRSITLLCAAPFIKLH